MIRDPSDGSTKSAPAALPSLPSGESSPVVTLDSTGADPLFEQIKSALLAGKVKPERISDKWEYQRAWNDGIEFALRQIQQIQKGN